MTYQPPQQPPHPPNGWQQPTAVQPPVKRAPWKVIGGITAGILVLCCGGLTAIGYFAEDPDQQKTAGLAATASVTAVPGNEQTTEAADAVTSSATTPPAASKPAASPSPGAAAKTSKPTVRPTTTRPQPRPTTKRPKPRPTTKSPKPRPATQEPEPEEVYYKNCTAVRAAGADPIHRGEPGYARHLDRDGDGVGCE